MKTKTKQSTISPAANAQTSNLPTAAERIAAQFDTRWLTQGRVVVCGLGGIGGILARYLILFLASLPDEIRVLFYDGDTFDPVQNGYRMDVPAADNKARALANELTQRFSRSGLSIRARTEFLTQANCRDLIRDGDVLLLCVDNHATRKLASDRISELKNGVLISAGNQGVGPGERGTYGNLQVLVRQGGQVIGGAPLDAFHPEIAHPADKNPAELDCMALAAQGAPQLLPTNLAMASAMLSALVRLLMLPVDETMYDEVCLDIVDAKSVPCWVTRQQQLPRRKRKAK